VALAIAAIIALLLPEPTAGRETTPVTMAD